MKTKEKWTEQGKEWTERKVTSTPKNHDFTLKTTIRDDNNNCVWTERTEF